jgi:hypothetical protein
MTREPPPIEFRAAHEIGIGMTDKCAVVMPDGGGALARIKLYAGASYYLREAFERGLAASVAGRQSDADKCHEYLRQAARHLGYGLVPLDTGSKQLAPPERVPPVRLWQPPSVERIVPRHVAEDDRP